MSNNLRNYISIPESEGQRMSVTAFVAGKYGHGIQFTIDRNYCCLAENQTRDLIKTLQKRLASIKKYQATRCDIDLTVEPLVESK
jgi:hypothetical protein